MSTLSVPSPATALRRSYRERSRQGLVLWRGTSCIDCTSPVVCIATQGSKNPKTGARTIQTWILQAYLDPLAAIRYGLDSAVCGDCIHRRAPQRTCYVTVGQAPLAVWRAWQRGTYPAYHPGRHRALFRDRVLRLGSYGDPVAVPLSVWQPLVQASAGHLGYTHQWRTCDPAYRSLLMASCDTLADRADAQSRGWRTFRVRLPGATLDTGEFACPASAEAGHRLTCAQCRACDGATRSPRAASPSIVLHGGDVGGNWRVRRFAAMTEPTHALVAGRVSLPLLGDLYR